MSWQEYVDGYIINYYPTSEDADVSTACSNACTGGAIIDLSTKQICAVAGDVKLLNGKVDQAQEDGSTKKIDLNEIQNLIAIQQNPSVIPTGGVRINGVKHTVVGTNSNFNSVYLKRSGGGATVAKTETLLVLGTWNATSKATKSDGEQVLQTPQLCSKAVEEIQSFLTESGL